MQTERDTLRLDDIISVLQQNSLQWYGHVLRKEDTDWVRNVWNLKWRFQAKRYTKENLERDCGKRLSGTWIMDHSRWMKQIRDD